MRILNYIDGELTAPTAGTFIDNVNPATGRVYGSIPDSDATDLDHAVSAAERAHAQWGALPAEERAACLRRIAALIDAQSDELALAESEDSGKPVALARAVDIARASSNFRFFADAATQFASQSHAMNQAINYTLRDPLGVVACISPWNLPLYLFTWKIAPALATGNTVIAKPSEITPRTAFMLSSICQQADLPPGVLNVVHGRGGQIGTAISAHPGIKAISFTGGTATGATIARAAAPQFKKLSLELGGKNPALVFADCDFEKTVAGVMRAMFTNQGQICLCASRIYIERAIYETFKAALLERVAALTVGDPNDDVDMGALVSEPHMRKVLDYIALAQREGGKILAGGRQLRLRGRCKEGYFVEPTLIEGLAVGCRTNQEEIFGPVVTLQPFDTEAQVLALANGTEYGLAATLWTENLTRTHRLCRQLEFGIVWVNCWLLRDLRTPFGGMKHSGTGREGGQEAMRFFTETKNVCVNYGD
jgi:aminomuconate-semialdehyde/2-hydroxymuconate-6-semialdehyde dehydrogenase